MLKLTSEGIVLPIKVIPGARETKLVGWENGALKIKVTAPPEKGEANRALLIFLSKILETSQKNICLIKGAHSRQKLFLITHLTLEFTEKILNK